MRRRTFLKTAALVAVGSALPACKPQIHKLVPYVLPDDEIVPGVADWYASTCHECSAGCGVLVRTMEGRAKKIEGNPDHPVNQGKLCARGQAALQALYHPDRVRGPLQRDGRETGMFQPLSWDDAIRSILKELRSAQGRIVMISRPLSGTLAGLLIEFMEAVGGELYWYDPAAELPLRTSLRSSFGADALPQYDLAGADFLLSFGAPFLEHWLSPVSYGAAYGQMRQGRATVRGRFVQIEPRLSLTAANADRWIPIRPGAEGLLALGIGRVVLDETPGRIGTEQRRLYDRAYAATPLDEVARHTDISRDDIVRLGREVAAARHPLAIGGGPACAHTNGTQSLAAINSLNALLGNVGRPGGVRFFHPTPFPGPSAEEVSWFTERKVAELGAQFETGERTLLLLNDCNPLFAMPPSVPIEHLFTQASFIVSFGPFLDESASRADLVCPGHVWLESWSDQVSPGLPVQSLSLTQPVVRPLYDTRPIGDTILHLARAVQPERFPWKAFTELLQDRWTALAGGPSPEGFEKYWLTHLQQGGSWEAAAVPLPVAGARMAPAVEQARFFGDEQDFPLYFYPYPSMTLGYGGAHLPWLQELPDTLTTAVWGTWVEINPVTAMKYGIAQGDVVRIQSMVGAIEAPALLFPGIRPDVVAVPVGQGHTAYGRYAKGRGVNPLHLVAPAFDHESGALASGATRVRIESTGAKGSLVLLEQPAVEASSLIQVDRVKPG